MADYHDRLMNTLTRISLVCSSIALTLAACDIGENKLGNETLSGGVGDSDADSEGGNESEGGETDGTEGGGSAESGQGGGCELGEQRPAGDGCNTCTCAEDGNWACTDAACPSCEEGDVTMNPDGCICDCVDGGFVCPESCVCEPGDEMPAGDGCNTCTCVEDGSWACTDIACQSGDGNPFDGPEVEVCDPGVPMDPLVVNGVHLEGDTLTVDVAYSGGCTMHFLGACWDEIWEESLPVQTGIAIAHNSNGDVCTAYPSDQVVIDLSPIAVAYQNAYGAGSATVHIHLAGWPETIAYAF